MKKILVVGAMMALIPFTSFAQTTSPSPVSTVTPGLLPGDFFYFMDRLSETLSLAFTFNNEKKVRKHLEYAKERVAEIGEVLTNPEAVLSDISAAKSDFDERVAKAVTLVKEEKNKGADVSDLAREIDDELDDSIEEIKEILKKHQERSSKAEEVIREKLSTLSPEDPQYKGLTQALESITKEKDSALKEGFDMDSSMSDEQADLEEVMGEELSERKHLEQEMRIREEKRINIEQENQEDDGIGEMELDGLDAEIMETERALERMGR